MIRPVQIKTWDGTKIKTESQTLVHREWVIIVKEAVSDIYFAVECGGSKQMFALVDECGVRLIYEPDVILVLSLV